MVNVQTRPVLLKQDPIDEGYLPTLSEGSSIREPCSFPLSLSISLYIYLYLSRACKVYVHTIDGSLTGSR